MHNIVIAGHGIAGLTAGDTLRRQGFEGTLTIIGEDPHPTYSRPALSKAALDPTADLMDTILPTTTHDTHHTTTIHGCVTGVDADAGVVTLGDGIQVPYDGLIIATGTRARRFTDDPNEYTLRTLDDAAALRSRLSTKPSVTIIGGGPLGMEVASGARALGCRVRLVQFGLPMAVQMGPVIAHILTAAATDHGVEIIDALVKSVSPTSSGLTVELDDGSVLDSEVVVSAIGDSANTDWLEGSGLLTDGRLVSDSRGRIRDNIVAAGDVVWFNGQRCPVWTSAIEEARIAATALLHGNDAPEISYQPYFWTDQFGLNVKISGPVPHEGDPVVVEGSLAERSALLHWPELGSAAAINYRMPVPRLHRLAKSATTPVSTA